MEYLSISSRTRHGGSRLRGRREEGEKEEKERKDELFLCKPLREHGDAGFLHASQTHLSSKQSKIDDDHPLSRLALTR